MKIDLKMVDALIKNIRLNLNKLNKFNKNRVLAVSANLNLNSFMKKNDNFHTDIPRRLVYYDKDFRIGAVD